MNYVHSTLRPEISELSSEPLVFQAPGLRRVTYLVAEPALHTTLSVKAKWLRLGSAAAIIVGQPLAFSLMPQLYQQTGWFFAYVLAVVLLWSGAAALLLRNDLRGLTPRANSLPLATRRGFSWMAGLAGSTVLAIAAGLLLLDGDYPAVALFSLICAGATALRFAQASRVNG